MTTSPRPIVGRCVCDSLAILPVRAAPVNGGTRTDAALRPTPGAGFAVADLHSFAPHTDTSLDAVPSARRHVAGTAPFPPASPAPPPVASAGLPLFCDHRLQRSDVYRLFGHDMLELPVLLFQRSQPSRLAHFHPSELPLPPIKTRSCDSVPAAQFFAESTLTHNSSSRLWASHSKSGEVSLTLDYFPGGRSEVTIAGEPMRRSDSEHDIFWYFFVRGYASVPEALILRQGRYPARR